MNTQTHRAREILAAVTRAYPSAWQQAEHLRAARGKGLPDWPEWCYLPMHGAYAIVSGGGENRVAIENAHHIGIVGALAAWRMGQQIIRYDETLYQSLCSTPISGELPTELLFRIPVWCLYIETPGLIWPVQHKDIPIHGFFAHIDWDERNHCELRLLLDTCKGERLLTTDVVFHPRNGLIPVPLILGDGTIREAFERTIKSGADQTAKIGHHVPTEYDPKFVFDTLSPMISLVLYLCSEQPDWDLEPPQNPPIVKTKNGPRAYPVAQPRVWDVGVRIGAALRTALASQPSGMDSIHAVPRAHLRRAHWHTYLIGAGRSKRVLKWLHPILVKTEILDDLPATIRPIKRRPNATDH